MQNAKAIKQIEEAFADVTLGQGVSLREADVIECDGSHESRVIAREEDELCDWRRIPNRDIEMFDDVLSIMDDDGLRFHLPAFMIYALRHNDDSDVLSTGVAIGPLYDPGCIKRLLVCLTDRQIEAVKSFINAYREPGREWLDVPHLTLAVRQWEGDESA